jgi:hypothetical protein
MAVERVFVFFDHAEHEADSKMMVWGEIRSCEHLISLVSSSERKDSMCLEMQVYERARSSG